MNDLIQSLPSPSTYSGNYSHMDEGIMDGRWRDVGDDDGVCSPPNPHPGRVPERSFWFRITVSGGGGATELYLGKNAQPPMFSGQRIYVGGRRGRGDGWGGHTTPWCGLAWPAPPGGVSPSWPLSILYSGSVCLLVK
jgi:hypothetical protein